ncbi:hypothetical protein [Acidocella sp.]|uniref:hypothetical protein n=1 Tax=Acidocella sp. TaxID=50710 RepID=UPI0026223C16|nr:hypothetical protein [Acidocella sp.]
MSHNSVTADTVCEALATAQGHQSSAATPDELEVAELTRWINIYLASPWDAELLAAQNEAHRRNYKQRATLEDAAQILRRDLEALQNASPINAEWAVVHEQERERLQIAINVLETRRATPLGSPPGFVSTSRGDARSSARVEATVLAELTIRAIQAAQKRLGHARKQWGAGDRSGAVVQTVAFWLRQIHGEDAPSVNVLYDWLRDIKINDSNTGGI